MNKNYNDFVKEVNSLLESKRPEIVAEIFVEIEKSYLKGEIHKSTMVRKEAELTERVKALFEEV